MNGSSHLDTFFACWLRRDAAAIAAFYAPNAVMEDPTLPEPREGRAAIERYYAEMYAGLTNPVHELLDWAEREGRIWFEWTFGSDGRDGRAERYHGVSIQTLRDGLIVHDAAFWNPS